MFYCEPMPLEATGDNVQLTAFVAKATNSTVEARPFLRTCVATRTCLETHVFQPPNCPAGHEMRVLMGQAAPAD